MPKAEWERILVRNTRTRLGLLKKRKSTKRGPRRRPRHELAALVKMAKANLRSRSRRTDDKLSYLDIDDSIT
jgi:hypothetical protein